MRFLIKEKGGWGWGLLKMGSKVSSRKEKRSLNLFLCFSCVGVEVFSFSLFFVRVFSFFAQVCANVWIILRKIPRLGYKLLPNGEMNTWLEFSYPPGHSRTFRCYCGSVSRIVFPNRGTVLFLGFAVFVLCLQTSLFGYAFSSLLTGKQSLLVPFQSCTWVRGFEGESGMWA